MRAWFPFAIPVMMMNTAPSCGGEEPARDELCRSKTYDLRPGEVQSIPDLCAEGTGVAFRNVDDLRFTEGLPWFLTKEEGGATNLQIRVANDSPVLGEGGRPPRSVTRRYTVGDRSGRSGRLTLNINPHDDSRNLTILPGPDVEAALRAGSRVLTCSRARPEHCALSVTRGQGISVRSGSGNTTCSWNASCEAFGSLCDVDFALVENMRCGLRYGPAPAEVTLTVAVDTDLSEVAVVLKRPAGVPWSCAGGVCRATFRVGVDVQLEVNQGGFQNVTVAWSCPGQATVKAMQHILLSVVEDVRCNVKIRQDPGCLGPPQPHFDIHPPRGKTLAVDGQGRVVLVNGVRYDLDATRTLENNVTGASYRWEIHRPHAGQVDQIAGIRGAWTSNLGPGEEATITLTVDNRCGPGSVVAARGAVVGGP